jgi:hypothetical protein
MRAMIAPLARRHTCSSAHAIRPAALHPHTSPSQTRLTDPMKDGDACLRTRMLHARRMRRTGSRYKTGVRIASITVSDQTRRAIRLQSTNGRMTERGKACLRMLTCRSARRKRPRTYVKGIDAVNFIAQHTRARMREECFSRSNARIRAKNVCKLCKRSLH